MIQAPKTLDQIQGFKALIETELKFFPYVDEAKVTVGTQNLTAYTLHIFLDLNEKELLEDIRPDWITRIILALSFKRIYKWASKFVQDMVYRALRKKIEGDIEIKIVIK